jgi:hypothetical protein
VTTNTVFGVKMNDKLFKSYQGNTIYLQNIMKDFCDEDLMLSTGESNTIGWIFGHIILYRGKVLEHFDSNFHLKESEKQFSRGVEKNKNIKMNFIESMNEYTSRGEQIVNELNNTNEEYLRKDIKIKYQGKDLDLEGMISMLSWHETFHIGQIDLIKAAVGKGGVK